MSARLIKQFIFISLLSLMAAASVFLFPQTSRGEPETTHQSPDVGKADNDHADHSEAPDSEGDAEGSDHEGHDATENAVHLTEAQRSKLDLKVVRAGAGSADAIIQAPASVQFNADAVARVGPRLQSKVVRVIKDLGEHVKAGEIVAVLDSVALGKAKARYLTADARYQSALAEYQRDKKLAAKQITSEAELIRSRAAYLEARAEKNAVIEELRLYGLNQEDISAIQAGGKQPLSRYPLASPVDGIIQKRDLVPGQTLSPQDTPIHVVDTDRMWVMIDVSEQAIPKLAPDQVISLSLRGLPEMTFEGKTDWVSRELDRQSRTIRVRAIVPNTGGKLRAGMFGTARIRTQSRQQYALIPVDAVQTIGGNEVVFVPGKEAGAFRAVTVRTGEEGNGMIEIRQGIAPGDKVVATGSFDLKSFLTAGERSASHGH